jgi:intracellular septation protein A
MKINVDKIGMFSSLTCAIHCTIMPLIVTMLPIIGLSLLATEEFEWMLLIGSAMLGIISLCFGFKKHKSLKALSFLSTGLALIVIGRLTHHHYHSLKFLHLDLYVLFLITGGVLVSFSHWLNNKLCSSCDPCKTSGCDH